MEACTQDETNGSAETASDESKPDTSYAFTGSALGKESIAKINVKATTAINEENASDDDGNSSKSGDTLFECNICLDPAKDAVLSMCGHLFCWPCIYQWLETRPNNKVCPVCKASIEKDRIIPIYGRNSVNQEDPRNKVPPRPAGQRVEPEPQQQQFPGFFPEGFHMSFGIGAFPFGFFTSTFNFGEPRAAEANRNTLNHDQQQLSKLFLYMALLLIIWLIFS